MMPVAVVLGSLTIPGRPEQVSRARKFVAALAGLEGPEGSEGPVAETAGLLTSELVTNAVLHTSSGREGGRVTVVVVDLPDGLLVEVHPNPDDALSDGPQSLTLAQFSSLMEDVRHLGAALNRMAEPA